LQLASRAAHPHTLEGRIDPTKFPGSTPSGLYRPQAERSRTRHASKSSAFDSTAGRVRALDGLDIVAVVLSAAAWSLL
jgi:hypothetical protein